MESVRYVLTKPRIGDLMAFTALVTFFGFSNYTHQWPVHARHRFGLAGAARPAGVGATGGTARWTRLGL